MLVVVARWGGLAGVAGGVLFAVWGYVHRGGAPPYFAAIANALAFVVPLLFLVALAGLYARCRAAMGWLGGLGFVFGAIGGARGVFDAVAGDPSRQLYAVGLGWAAPLLEWLFLVLISLTLMGMATIRAGSQGWSSLPLVVGLLGFAYNLTDSGGFLEAGTVHTVCGVLFSSAWVALGASLWSGRKGHVAKSPEGVLHHR